MALGIRFIHIYINFQKQNMIKFKPKVEREKSKLQEILVKKQSQKPVKKSVKESAKKQLKKSDKERTRIQHNSNRI